jgi:hypothetical protein
MAGIKNINIISGTGNPVQMQDLQNLWSAINSLLRSTKTPISIVAGFATANNDTGTNIGEGIICYQGQAYYLAADVAKIGQYLYANTIQDEQRVYEDGATRYTYQDYVVNAAANASASGIGTLIGQATAANLAAWKVGVLSDGSVTAAMLADGAVTTPKLANSAVTTAKIADRAVGSLQIGVEAIKNGNIQDKQITGSKMADQSIPGSKLNNKTITGTQIADKAITADKIADATITAAQIEAETITNEEILNHTINAADKMVPSSVEESCIATAAVGSRQLQVAAVNTPAIMNKAITLEKLADKISVLLPNTVTSITHNISSSPINFPEGTIGTLNIPPSPSNHAITVYLVSSSSGLLVHHWTMLVFKNDVGPFQITFFLGGSVGTRRFDLPQYAINCILDIYFYAPYGLIVGVAQPNFIVK